MRTLFLIFIFFTLTGFASSIVLVCTGSSMWILAFGIIGGATTIQYYKQYKAMYPKDVVAFKRVVAVLGSAAAYAIRK